MENLEQIRAKNALDAAKNGDFRGQEGGDVVRKMPAMIRENGMLCTLAFAIEKGEGYESVMKFILKHLKEVHQVSNRVGEDLKEFLGELVRSDSAKLRAVTQESLAYLNYLRRFVKK